MKLHQLIDQIEHLKKHYKDIEDWDVFVETELFTVTSKYGDEEEINHNNAETMKKISEAKQAGWKFVECQEFDDNGKLMSTDYYKEVAGGIGLKPDSKSVLICINY